MLRELTEVQQLSGEPRRRWFRSGTEDLIVWYAQDGSVLGFQLCYETFGDERALTWRRDRGFTHERVDAGENEGLAHKRAPMLVPDGEFNALRVLQRFEAAAAQLPQDVVELVSAKLRQYPRHEEDT